MCFSNRKRGIFFLDNFFYRYYCIFKDSTKLLLFVYSKKKDEPCSLFKDINPGFLLYLLKLKIINLAKEEERCNEDNFKLLNLLDIKILFSIN